MEKWTETYYPMGDKHRIGGHFLFWTIYALWNQVVFAPEFMSLSHMVTTGIFVTAHALACYFNMRVLMPRFLEKGKVFKYILGLALSLGFFSLLLFAGLYSWLYFIYPPAIEKWLGDTAMFYGSIVGSTSTIVFFTMALRMIRQKMLNEKKQAQKEKANLETELKFLKDQLNPHFLFNALNSIYFLIRKDPELAETSLAGFSDLLRYQLYGANDDLILLESEIAFLEKYAALASLRKSNDLEVNWALPKNLTDVQIAPLLLIPFVENAFKHVAIKNGKININLELNEQQQLRFSIYNNSRSPEEKAEHDLDVGGIGLQNVKRRLELLYTNQHLLTIKEPPGGFEVMLEIQLSKAKAATTPLQNITTKL